MRIVTATSLMMIVMNIHNKQSTENGIEVEGVFETSWGHCSKLQIVMIE